MIEIERTTAARAPMIELEDAPTAALSPILQSIARNYIGARARAGGAILDTARYLAEAREAAKYGEWGVFLESTGTTEDTATRMIAIATRASADPQYARAVGDGRLALTAAFEILNAPAEMQQRALESETPTPPSVIRKAKQESKLRTSAEFEPPILPDLSSFGFTARALPDGRIAIRSEGNLESEHTHAQLNDLIALWRGYPAIPADLAAAGVAWRYWQDKMYQVMREDKIGQTGYMAAECLTNQRESMERMGLLDTPAETETDDSATMEEIRTLAHEHGLEVVWEDDEVLLFWPGEDLDVIEPMGYTRAIDWLIEEAGMLRIQRESAPDTSTALTGDSLPPKLLALALSDLDALLPADLFNAGYFWHSATPPTIAHNVGNWRGDAPTVEGALALARDREKAKDLADRRLPAPIYVKVMDLIGKLSAAVVDAEHAQAAKIARAIAILIEQETRS